MVMKLEKIDILQDGREIHVTLKRRDANLSRMFNSFLEETKTTTRALVKRDLDVLRYY